MKRLKKTSHCCECGEAIQPFERHSEQQIYTRRYVGGKGHLIDLAYHKDGLMDNLYIDFLLSSKYKL